MGLLSFQVLFIFLFKIHIQMSNRDNHFLKSLQFTFILVSERPYFKTLVKTKVNSYFFQDLVISQALSSQLFILDLRLILVYFVRNFGNPMTVLQVSFDLGFPLKINLPPNGVWAQPSSYSVDNNFLYRGQSRRGVNLTTHLHLIPILKMSGFMLLIPSVSSWTVQGEIYLYLYSFLSAPYSSVISCWYIRPV